MILFGQEKIPEISFEIRLFKRITRSRHYLETARGKSITLDTSMMNTFGTIEEIVNTTIDMTGRAVVFKPRVHNPGSQLVRWFPTLKRGKSTQNKIVSRRTLRAEITFS